MLCVANTSCQRKAVAAINASPSDMARCWRNSTALWKNRFIRVNHFQIREQACQYFIFPGVKFVVAKDFQETHCRNCHLVFSKPSHQGRIIP